MIHFKPRVTLHYVTLHYLPDTHNVIFLYKKKKKNEVQEGKLQLEGPAAETRQRVTAVTVNFQICDQKQKHLFDNMSDLN